MSPENKPLFLIVPSLPNLYEGVSQEVLSEIKDNPALFVIRAGRNMVRENPVFRHIVEHLMCVSPDFDTSISLLTGYYELYSRSAKKEDVPMMVVTEDLALRVIQKNLCDIREANSDLLDGKIKFLTEKSIAEKKRVQKDVLISKELQIFWDYVNETISKMRDIGVSDKDIFLIMSALQIAHELFHVQDESNKTLQAKSFVRLQDKENPEEIFS